MWSINVVKNKSSKIVKLKFYCYLITALLLKQNIMCNVRMSIFNGKLLWCYTYVYMWV